MGDGHICLTYNEIHRIIGDASHRIAAEFKPDMLIAIGGGGFFPARVMRTFLKDPATKRNIPIQAIGLSLYESLPGTTEEQIGNEVIRTQWLGPETKVLLGRRVLIIDEVDDSRQTLHYAVSELQKDVEKELASLPEEDRETARTKFAVFVVHNKLKTKHNTLPPDIPYYAGAEVPNIWLDYPWEGAILHPTLLCDSAKTYCNILCPTAKDIDEHDRLARLTSDVA